MFRWSRTPLYVSTADLILLSIKKNYLLIFSGPAEKAISFGHGNSVKGCGEVISAEIAYEP